MVLFCLPRELRPDWDCKGRKGRVLWIIKLLEDDVLLPWVLLTPALWMILYRPRDGEIFILYICTTFLVLESETLIILLSFLDSTTENWCLLLPEKEWQQIPRVGIYPGLADIGRFWLYWFVLLIYQLIAKHTLWRYNLNYWFGTDILK